MGEWATINRENIPNTATFNWNLDPKTVSGEYRIEDIRLYDYAGNLTFYYGTDDSLGTFGTYTFDIDNPIQDNQTPQLTDFKLSGTYDENGRKILTVRTLIDDGADQETGIKLSLIHI